MSPSDPPKICNLDSVCGLENKHLDGHNTARGFLFVVFVSLGCSNRIYWYRQTGLGNKHLALTDRMTKIKIPAGQRLVRNCFLVCRQLFSHILTWQRAKKKRKLSCMFSIKALIASWWLHPHDLITFQRLHPKTITLRISVSTYGFGGRGDMNIWS